MFGLPDFVLNKTVKIKIGEKLYTEDDVWIRLDSITVDTRNYLTNTPGRVVAEFTVGQDTSGVEVWKQNITFVTDTMNSQTFNSCWQGDVGEGNFYIMTITRVSPHRIGEVDIPDEDYRVSFVIEKAIVAYKPNIYLYPKKTTQMTVSLDFPKGGKVIESIPDFPDKWKKIKVEPDAKINETYDYLFYEASLPNKWQYKQGWSVTQSNLEAFFRSNLADYGFIENEINDFLDYWIPRLIEHSYYNIYPQHTDKINELIDLKISKKPRSLLRMFYVIEPVRSPMISKIDTPIIPEFERKGFTVAEWGVVFK
jgi:hypothetical protein